MTSILNIRESINSKLDKWDAQISALQAQLELSKDQVVQRVDKQKNRLEKSSLNVMEKIHASNEHTSETKLKIKASFEHLQLQLTLGTMDTRLAYQDWKQNVQCSLVKFEADLELTSVKEDEALKAEMDVLMEEYVKEVYAMDAEIEAMAFKFDDDKARIKADFENERQEVLSKIDSYKEELTIKRKEAADKLEIFESELSDGASKIKESVKNLFSS